MTRQQMTDEQVGQILRLADAVGEYEKTLSLVQKGMDKVQAGMIIERFLYELDFCDECGLEGKLGNGWLTCPQCEKRWREEPEVIR